MARADFPEPTTGRIKNPAPSAWMSHRAMVALVGRNTANEGAQRGTTLMVPSTRDRVGTATITNMDAWRWNRWNSRWERVQGAKHIA